jgi:hypothetical protein
MTPDEAIADLKANGFTVIKNWRNKWMKQIA